MILDRFLEWSDELRIRQFRGRELLGRFYRFVLFGVFDQSLKLLYRVRISLKLRTLYPFTVSNYRLLKEVRRVFPRSFLLKSWNSTLPVTKGLANYDDLIAQVHATKNHAPSKSWILPETAVFSPSLDCKGFAILLSALLNVHGIDNELWIGLPSDGTVGHAWIVVVAEGERIAVDQFNGHGTKELLYLHDHPYAMTARI
jgi:hypothetical protein